MSNPEPKSPRLLLAFSLASLSCIFGASLPLFFGHGVDLPDDGLFYFFSTWEWLEHSLNSGETPLWVPGRLGGTSLYSEGMSMAPWYPASLLLLIFPAALALPLAMSLHALGGWLAVFVLGRTYALRPFAAAFAATGVSLSPLVTVAFVEVQADAITCYLWFSLALASHRKASLADGKKARLAGAGAFSACIGMLLLSSHFRWAAATCGALGLLVLLSRRHIVLFVGAMLVGVAAGSPGFLPLLMEIRLNAEDLNRISVLAGPDHEPFTLWNLSGWMSPKPHWMSRDYSLGAVLGIAILAGLAQVRARGLGTVTLFGSILMAAAISPSIPGLRWVFLPLLVLTHPINLFYAAIALIPLSLLAGASLDRLIVREPPPLLKSAREFLIPALVLIAMGIRVLPAIEAFPSEPQRLGALTSLLQGLGVFTLFLVLTRVRARSVRRVGIAILLLADLSIITFRLHASIPSQQVDFAARTDPKLAEDLAGGYVDLSDIRDLQPFLYDSADMTDAPEELLEESAPRLSSELLSRSIPANAGVALGLRSLSGRARVPPSRSIKLMSSLTDELRARQGDEEATRALFDPGSFGRWLLQTARVEVVADSGGPIARVPGGAPLCYAPAEASRIDDISQLRSQHPEFGGITWPSRVRVELPSPLPDFTPPEALECLPNRRARWQSDRSGLFVISEQHHPGWSLRTDSGRELELWPAEGLHMAAVIPPGQHSLHWSFVPPGLRLSALLAALSWLLLLGLWLSSRRSLG